MVHRQRLRTLRAAGTRRLRRTRARTKARRRAQPRIILIGGRRPRERKRKLDIGLFLQQQLLGTGFPKEFRVEPVPIGGPSIGRGAKVLSLLGKFGKGTAKATLPQSFALREIAKPVGALTVAGFVGTPGGRAQIRRGVGFFVGKGAEAGEFGILESLRRTIFGPRERPILGPFRPEDKRGNGIFGLPTPIVLGAGLGAGLAALAGALTLRQRGRALTPPALAAVPTVGALEAPPEAAVGAPALEKALPDINIRVRPQINVKTTVKPKIINILQSSSMHG